MIMVDSFVMVVGTMDTKAEPLLYLKRAIEGRGLPAKIMDVGLGKSGVEGDISREEVLSFMGDSPSLPSGRDEGIRFMAEAGRRCAASYYRRGLLRAMVSLGGGTGLYMGLHIFKGIPQDVPKLAVSTLARDGCSYMDGVRGVVLMESPFDFVGECSLLKDLMDRVSGVLASLIPSRERPMKKAVSITTFGITSGYVKAAVDTLEKEGYEVAVFHAAGTGGACMEDLIKKGYFSGVLDLTTHELMDRIAGGDYGEMNDERFSVAPRMGIPVVYSTGGLDSVAYNLSRRCAPPERGVLYRHDVRVVSVPRLDEVRKAARVLCERVKDARAPVLFLIPTCGWSEPGRPGGPLFSRELIGAFVEELERGLPRGCSMELVRTHINDPGFGVVAAKRLISMMGGMGG